MSFFALNRKELGGDADIVLVTGDAYVDHPSFGISVIGHIFEANGYKVGIIPRPDVSDPNAFRVFGRPRIGFFINSGNMDSMVNNYTVAKRKRRTDVYAPGNKYGGRPDYALTVYGRAIKKAYPDVPLIAGGMEASLRRLGHYDYWSDSVKRSVLLDSEADLLCWGMGERSDLEIANAIAAGTPVSEINWVKGTVWKSRTAPEDAIVLPSYEDICKDKKKYCRSFIRQYENCDAITARPLAERYVHDDCYVVVNPPQEPLTTEEMDAVYELPYERTYHPIYESQGGISAISEVKFSLVSNRGCFGACSFCAITFHQGRTISVRSHESLVKEAELLTKLPDFKGYIHDVGGPTANFRHPSCQKQLKYGVCKNRQCLGQSPCPNLEADHTDYIELLRKLRQVKGVKKVFVRSGIRYDYILQDPNGDAFIEELVKHHVSGQLKVAPEHVSDHVLSMMGKPGHDVFLKVRKKYFDANRKAGKDQYLVPYFISSHPGCTLNDAIELAEYLRDIRSTPEQVQDFYPTPGTLSTCMYYTGLDPRTMEPVYVAKDPREKELQRCLMQYRIPENAARVREALRKAGRTDLIGTGPKCLVPPAPNEKTADRSRNPQGGRHGAPAGKKSGAGAKRAKKKTKKRT
ncbi:MAG: YgiQ family radical SAM protein [Oscillospiraceae bacterium]|nr:YgiQ family radical SAM protein [Oscillospiraceae bacterium]